MMVLFGVLVGALIGPFIGSAVFNRMVRREQQRGRDREDACRRSPETARMMQMWLDEMHDAIEQSVGGAR